MARFLDLRSDRMYIGLVALLAICGAASAVLLPSTLPQTVTLPVSKPVMALATGAIMLFAYGGLGLIGLRLSERLGFPGLLDSSVSQRDRFLVPAIVGGMVGVGLIVAD